MMNRPHASKPAMRPRAGGGFNQGFGALNEHMDENALQQAVAHKQQGQQATSSGQTTTGGSALGQQQADGALDQAGLTGKPPAPVKPREVGTLQEELVTRPLQDIQKGLLSLFDIRSVLGIDPKADTPEEQAKKRQMLQRWNELTQDEQKVAQERYQKEMQKKQMEEEEKQQRKQQEEAAKEESIAAPSSPQKGPAGPGASKKQKAAAKLQSDRKKLGGPSGSN